MAFGFRISFCVRTLLAAIAIAFLQNLQLGGCCGNRTRECDLFTGRWVLDESYPPYNAANCPFVRREFSCQRNGRPDSDYTKYRWQPLGCNLVSFDGRDFLERWRGKKIMFVGDSLSQNQWQSLTCMLHSALPNSPYNLTVTRDVSTFTFTDFDVEVMMNWNAYLVDIVKEDVGRVMKLDSIEEGKLIWKGIDMLIFNTWHWWYRRGSSQPWDYVQVGTQISKDIDRMLAFEKALTTWANWVDTTVDPEKTLVFFQGISPSHYNGTEWNEPGVTNCVGQKQPLSGSTYPGGPPLALSVLKGVLSKMRKPVQLLDITNLSQLRKDGHPSIYGKFAMDCTHWCIAGVADTWNQILYNLIL